MKLERAALDKNGIRAQMGKMTSSTVKNELEHVTIKENETQSEVFSV